ncbi:MAG: J domain-containing protein [Isosphaeraceae bacterium]
MAAPDYYETLGIPRDAVPAAIKKAYRNLARKYHPDVNPGDKKAEARFKEVQQAYDILSDAEKRTLYDRFGHAAFEGMAAGPQNFQRGPSSPPGYESFDFSEFFGPGGARGASSPGNPNEQGGAAGSGLFEELIGRMRGGRGARRPGAAPGPRPGRNLEASLTVPFLTAIRGGETTIEVERDARRESLVVKIPAGIEPGARLRLKGQGEPGEKGAPHGDLTIVVDVEPHRLFLREGRNLTVEVPVTIEEAVLGARLEVPTPQGLRSLTIPPGSSSGQKLRLRGQGVPASGSKPAGDLFVILKIVVPKQLDDESRRLIQEFSGRNPLHPRENLWPGL